MTLTPIESEPPVDLHGVISRMLAFQADLMADGLSPMGFRVLLLLKTSPEDITSVEALAGRLPLDLDLTRRLVGDLAAWIDHEVRLTKAGEAALAEVAARRLDDLRALDDLLTAIMPKRRTRRGGPQAARRAMR